MNKLNFFKFMICTRDTTIQLRKKQMKVIMDFLTLLLLLSSVVWIIFQLFGPNSLYRRTSKLPPGPFPIPIIGNILQLGRNPHRSLAKLSKTYGPLMHLKLGSMQTIVLSSPEMLKEILQKHDQICCSRVVTYAVQALNHHETSMIWLPVGSKWRKFRKICNEHMFAMHKMEASEGLRQDKLQQLRNYLVECCSSGRVVNVGEVAFITTLNFLSATFFSLDFADYFHTNFGQEMKEIIKDLMKISGTPNLADYFSVLKLIDPKGLKRKTGVHFAKLLAKFEQIISKRLQSRGISSDSPKKNDLLEVLLDLNQENDSYLSLHDIKILFMDLIIAGPETIADTVEWAMAELIRNPEKMSKAKNELRTVIGENKQVEESDIPKLPYLQAVIKETFRRYPAGALLVPHKAEANVEINGYTIPKGAQILFNVWAIGRDSRIWSNPDSFEPQRFLDSKIDYKGQDFELLTFSSGRRICPGLPLAHRMVHLMVASMIHNFEWKLELGMKPEELDMNETYEFSLRKAVPLKAFPIRP